MLLQEQRRELTVSAEKETPPTELHLATRWMQRWQHTILKALTSDVTLLQNNASSYLLPCTLRCFPEVFDILLSALDSAVLGHLRAWVCIMSAQRAYSGRLSWNSEGNLVTLRLALSSLDNSVRLAAFSLICCSPKSKEPPLGVEYATMRDFLPFNLNSESSPFRQHLQAGVRKFLVRIRDSCMASLKGQKSKRGLSKEEEKELEQGIGTAWHTLGLSSTSVVSDQIWNHTSYKFPSDHTVSQVIMQVLFTVQNIIILYTLHPWFG